MEALKRFLESLRVKKPKPFNFLIKDAAGIFYPGRFWIPLERQEEFIQLYSKAAPHFRPQNCPALVYKCPNRALQPLQIDVDLKFKEKMTVPISLHQQFAECLAQELVSVLKQRVEFFVVSKAECYLKGNSYSHGAHIYFPELRINSSLAIEFSKYAEGRCLQFYGILQPTNAPQISSTKW